MVAQVLRQLPEEAVIQHDRESGTEMEGNDAYPLDQVQ